MHYPSLSAAAAFLPSNFVTREVLPLEPKVAQVAPVAPARPRLVADSDMERLLADMRKSLRCIGATGIASLHPAEDEAAIQALEFALGHSSPGCGRVLARRRPR